MSRPAHTRTVLVLVGLGALTILGRIVERQGPQRRPPDAEDRAAASQAKLQAHDDAIASAGEHQVRATLKDPASAEFEGVFGRTKHRLAVACGQVNAKNDFGAYTGSAFFVVEELTGEVIIQSLRSEARFQRAWKRDCTGRGDEAPPPPEGLFAIRWGDRPPASLKPYNAARQVWVFRGAAPARYLGVPITSAFYELDHGRIYGGDVVVKGQDSYDQIKAALTIAYGEPTTDLTRGGYTAWDWGKGSGIVQLSWTAATQDADVHLERQVRG